MPEYVEAPESPVVSFTSTAEGDVGAQDWFDLSVRVSVGGEDAGFEALFVDRRLGTEAQVIGLGFADWRGRPPQRPARALPVASYCGSGVPFCQMQGELRLTVKSRWSPRS
ncbi:hypothetical protein GCM10012284_33480 [Mangrovihabitans endophyticus]|uniref:Uncharacterized protein n=1 Tax=Mangrovihabitans endophyticus TaxID=1751298 RepID=A0A8J3C1I3_9ACTN|nr:hypothetical protein GCM10012284_33480 [Mangrovihabitans endophyticus]